MITSLPDMSEVKTMDLVSILFSLIFLLFSPIFLLKEYKIKKTKCDTVTEVTGSHDIEKSIEGSGTK